MQIRAPLKIAIYAQKALPITEQAKKSRVIYFCSHTVHYSSKLASITMITSMPTEKRSPIQYKPLFKHDVI